MSNMFMCGVGLCSLLMTHQQAGVRVSVQIAMSRGVSPVMVTIISKGALIEVGSHRLAKAGDSVTVAAPVGVSADLGSGGFVVSSPADSTWIKVDLGRPGAAPTMTASAAAIRISYDNGRVWLRGVPRADAR